MTLVPDRRLDGTNVLASPPTPGFAFAYGAGSFARHRAEAARLGLPARIVPTRLAWDVDLPADLAWPARRPPTGPPGRLTRRRPTTADARADLRDHR